MSEYPSSSTHPKTSYLPMYGRVGLALICISEIFCWMKIQPFYIFNTPFCWTGYILLLDALIYRRKKHSLIQTRTGEFIIMLVLSIILWLVFELYNVLLKNWYYDMKHISLWAQYFGFAWSFATIFPAIFETGELLDLYIPKKKIQPSFHKVTNRFVFWSVFTGLVCLVYPIMAPSPYLFAYVWLGFIFLLDPVNYTFDRPSLLKEWQRGSFRKFWILMLSGYVCGILWEFWNYWAGAKWIYTVPIGPNIHIFEMPIAGFLGFGPFALECFVMYAATMGLPGWGEHNRPKQESITSGILRKNNL